MSDVETKTIRVEVPRPLHSRWCDLRDRFDGKAAHLVAAALVDPPAEAVQIEAQRSEDLTDFVECHTEAADFGPIEQAGSDGTTGVAPALDDATPDAAASPNGNPADDVASGDVDSANGAASEETSTVEPLSDDGQAALDKLVEYLETRSQPVGRDQLDGAIPWSVSATVSIDDVDDALRAVDGVTVEETGDGERWFAAKDEDEDEGGTAANAENEA